MFDAIFKREYIKDDNCNVICDRDGNKLTKTVRRTPAEIRALPKEVLNDLNLIYKKWGNGRFLSMRLASWVGKDGKRAVMVLLEFGITDKNDKLTACNQIYMDIPTFAWFCELLRTGRMRERVEAACGKVRDDAVKAYKSAIKEAKRNGLEKPDYRQYAPTQTQYSVVVYQNYGGNERECRILKVYTGWDFVKNKRSDKICFEAGKGPGEKDANGRISPVGWTKENSSRVMVGFTDDELGMAGTMGAYALDLIRRWNSTGVLEEYAELINIRKESRDADERHGYQTGNSYERRGSRRNDVNRYAAGSASGQYLRQRNDHRDNYSAV